MIYDEDKMVQKVVYPTKQTPSYADWRLFEMGKELEEVVDGIGEGVTKEYVDDADAALQEQIDTKQDTITSGEMSITSTEWVNNSVTKSITNLNSKPIIISPSTGSYNDYVSNGIYVSGETTDTITFTASTTPTNTIVLNYVIIR